MWALIRNLVELRWTHLVYKMLQSQRIAKVNRLSASPSNAKSFQHRIQELLGPKHTTRRRVGGDPLKLQGLLNEEGPKSGGFCQCLVILVLVGVSGKLRQSCKARLIAARGAALAREAFSHEASGQRVGLVLCIWKAACFGRPFLLWTLKKKRLEKRKKTCFWTSDSLLRDKNRFGNAKKHIEYRKDQKTKHRKLPKPFSKTIGCTSLGKFGFSRAHCFDIWGFL